MECLTPAFSFDVFIDNYFRSFRLLTRLEANSIRATGVLNKNRIRKFMIIGKKQQQKKPNVAALSIAHPARKSSKTLIRTTVGLFTQLSESYEPKILFGCWNKVERKYIQEQQPNQFQCYNQNMGFVNIVDQNVAKYRTGIRMKK